MRKLSSYRSIIFSPTSANIVHLHDTTIIKGDITASPTAPDILVHKVIVGAVTK
jgi:hypothetical protein